MLWCRVGEENASERGRGTLKRRSFRSFLFLPGGDGRKTNARPPFLSSLPAQQPRFFGVDMKIRCRACARGTKRAEETRNATGTREKRFSPSSAHPPPKKKPSSSSSSSTHLFRSESGNDSDTEAFIDPKLAMYRLHEGVSHASRASDVGELHRLQKSSTKPRHDGKKKDNGSEKSEATGPSRNCFFASLQRATPSFFTSFAPLDTRETASARG